MKLFTLCNNKKYYWLIWRVKLKLHLLIEEWNKKNFLKRNKKNKKSGKKIYVIYVTAFAMKYTIFFLYSLMVML